MTKQPSKFRQFMEKFYWLPPLLLVAIVFILVFSLEGLDNVAATLKSWFSADAKCKQCELVKVDVNDNNKLDVIETGTAGEKIYIVYFDKNEEVLDNCFDLNHVLNAEIKAYNSDLKAAGKDELTVYRVNYGVKEYSEITGQEDVIVKWYDKTMSQDVYDSLSEDVRLFLYENDPSSVSAQVNGYTIVAPMLVEYTFTADNVAEVTNVLKATSDFTVANVEKFFNGTYETK